MRFHYLEFFGSILGLRLAKTLIWVKQKTRKIRFFGYRKPRISILTLRFWDLQPKIIEFQVPIGNILFSIFLKGKCYKVLSTLVRNILQRIMEVRLEVFRWAVIRKSWDSIIWNFLINFGPQTCKNSNFGETKSLKNQIFLDTENLGFQSRISDFEISSRK